MTAVKERLIGAITMMDDAKAEALWNVVITEYVPRSWHDIPEVKPDEWDLKMLKEVNENPECHEFISEKDIDWDNDNY